jgi:hypothetical protein
MHALVQERHGHCNQELTDVEKECVENDIKYESLTMWQQNQLEGHSTILICHLFKSMSMKLVKSFLK